MMVRRDLSTQAITVRRFGDLLPAILLAIVATNALLPQSKAASDANTPLPSLPPPPHRVNAPLRTPNDNGASSSQEPIPAKVYRYAERLIAEADTNGDKSLDRQEWPEKWGFLTTDANLDGHVTLGELVQRIGEYGQHRRIRLLPPTAVGEGTASVPGSSIPSAGGDQLSASGSMPFATPSSEANPETTERNTANLARKFVPSRARQPEGLPAWFASRDSDGDGQLSLAEFAPKPTGASLAEFDRYDRNGDGVITPDEYLRAVKSAAEEKGR